MSRPSQLNTLSVPGQVLFAVLFWAAGLALLAVAAGWLHRPGDANETPRWVLGAAGVMFLSGGFVPLTMRFGPEAWQSRLVGAIALLALAAIFNWIAFGPGARHFSGTLSIMGSPAASEGVSESHGRIVFAVMAIAIDLLAAAVALRWFRTRK